MSSVCCEDSKKNKKDNNAFTAEHSVSHIAIVQYVLVMMISFLSNLCWLFRMELVLSGQILDFAPLRERFFIAEASFCSRKKANYNLIIKNEQTIWQQKHKHKRKNRCWTLSKVNVFASKDIYHQEDEETTNRIGKLCMNDIFYKVLIFRLHKDLKLNNNNNNNTQLKMSKRLE